MTTARSRPPAGSSTACASENTSSLEPRVGKICVSAEQTAAELTAGIDAAEKRVRAAVPIAETIYLEPDIYRPGQEDPLDPSVAVVERNGAALARMISHQFPLAQAPQALQFAMNNPSDVMKVV